ncbi:MAG: M15 family metallopeptidase [Deltaproteobacteria bacterium]|nr:M15 family metallopeptidase [Deltaproteobacteria bacterium]
MMAGIGAQAAERGPECREQLAQDFLIRSSMLKDKRGFARAVQKAIHYRVEHYGYVDGAPLTKVNPKSAVELSRETRFLGLKVRLNAKILPALECAERAVIERCTDLGTGKRYAPRRLSGIRYKNTYRGGEISNHMFGTALDIDPDRNPCCGCVPPWSDVPQCRRHVKSIFERMEMPRCWVNEFERFGFYWLGWDAMGDTMHFEFLGDPDRILIRPEY